MPTVQLNVRIDVGISDIVERTCAERGWTKRQVVEHAIRTAYNDR